MTKSTINWCIIFGVATLFIGCGGANKKSAKDQMLDEVPDDYDLVADITGVDDSTPVKLEDEDEQAASAPVNDTPGEGEGEHIGGTQGAFVATIMLEGKSSKGTYSVKSLAQDGAVIKKGVRAGEEIRLAPGMYDMVFKAEKIVGKPTFELTDVEILKGRRIKREVKIPVGKIRLVTSTRGCAKKPIRIKPKGADDWYAGTFHTCTEMTVEAGTPSSAAISQAAFFLRRIWSMRWTRRRGVLRRSRWGRQERFSSPASPSAS